jgi:hypothetical protein
MDAFFDWLSTNPTATVIVGLLVATLAILFLSAFFQGREISLWPPKIGPIIKTTGRGGKPESHTLAEQMGLIATFENLEACRLDIQKEFERASDISLLLQLGRRELGDRKSSLFWSIAEQKSHVGVRIRILHASTNSPFLSDARAKFRGTPVGQWHEDLRRLREEIQRLKEFHEVKVEEREHSEPFLWRIFIFDDVAYISAYLYQKENDIKAPVYKFRRGDGSLYNIYSKYFEYLWYKYDPLSISDPTDKWAKWA